MATPFDQEGITCMPFRNKCYALRRDCAGLWEVWHAVVGLHACARQKLAWENGGLKNKNANSISNAGRAYPALRPGKENAIISPTKPPPGGLFQING